MRRLRRKLRTALSLSWGERLTLCQAWLCLLAVDLGLRVLPFRRVRDCAGRGVGEDGMQQARAPWAEIERVQRLVDMAGGNHLYAMHCLPRSLVLQRMLAQRGIASKLRLGVRREAGGLQAHAWVEVGGAALNDAGPVRQRFAVLDHDSVPADGRVAGRRLCRAGVAEEREPR